MVKHKRNRVANEMAVRKRMMEYTSQYHDFRPGKRRGARRMPKKSAV
jgi:hypothetical protein